MSKLKDLTGQKIGRLTVIKRLPNYRQENGRTRTRWLCQCACGNEYIGDGSHLLHGDVQSCGCLHIERSREWGKTGIPAKANGAKMKAKHDLTGMKYGKVTVIERCEDDLVNHKSMWLCQCECGTRFKVRTNHLIRNLVHSCGCMRSRGENFITTYLNHCDFNVKREVSFDDLVSSNGGRLRFDYGFYNNEGSLLMLMEYQGEQHNPDWKSDFGKQQRDETDSLKQKYCAEHNIPLREIWYRDNVEYELLSALCDVYGKPIPCQAEEIQKV